MPSDRNASLSPRDCFTRTVCRIGLALALATLAGAALAATEGEKAVAEVGARLRGNDCEGAVKALNAGLQAPYPEVALLAGTLFEAGFCLNKDWNKAIGFYTQAYEGGIREGAMRLAAGFAAAANGPDIAAALWWARRADLNANLCPAPLPDSADPDRFVQALRAWTAADLRVCNYVVGTVAFLSAEARYPMAGIAEEIAGRAEIVFTPARGHFRSEARGATRPAQLKIGAVMTKAISLAGARYPKPADLPASWQAAFVVVVDTDKGHWW